MRGLSRAASSSLVSRTPDAMERSEYLYGLDDSPSPIRSLLYGLQWAFIIFPALLLTATVAAKAFAMDPAEEIRFLQWTLITSGAFTIVQSLLGHRFPLFEGPSTALLLTYAFAAPLGIPAIQGSAMAAALCLCAFALVRKLDLLFRLFTPNVVGVILILIALVLLPHLIPSFLGQDLRNVDGDLAVFFAALLLVLIIAGLSHGLPGIWKTFSLMLGLLLGTVVFACMGRVSLGPFREASWMSLPDFPHLGRPQWRFSAFFAFCVTYVAVAVNTLGSTQGIAALLGLSDISGRLRRALLINGISGLFCGALGIVGTVSYSTGPGLVLSTRVASRFVLTSCGVLLMFTAFVPKLTALLAVVPPASVASAMVVAMGGQIGAGIRIITAEKSFESRDYFVVGVPVLLGTLLAFLPDSFIVKLPGLARVLLGNGLVAGIFTVLLLEHLLLRKAKEGPSP